MTKEAWGEDIAIRILKLGITRRQLAENIGMHYTQLCNVITNVRDSDAARAKIGAEVARLEEERNT